MRCRRHRQLRENPYDRAGRTVETDWMARKFLLLTERLAEVEGAVVAAFEAADGMALITLEYGVEDAYRALADSQSSRNERDEGTS